MNQFNIIIYDEKKLLILFKMMKGRSQMTSIKNGSLCLLCHKFITKKINILYRGVTQFQTLFPSPTEKEGPVSNTLGYLNYPILGYHRLKEGYTLSTRGKVGGVP